MISVAITAVPSRAEHVAQLVAQLEAERQFHRDEFPLPVEVFTDTDKLGCWGNARLAWARGAALGFDAHLVIQDDVVLSQDFLGGVAFLHAMKPTFPMSFFRLAGVDAARRENRHWVFVTRFLMAQALLMPKDVAQGFVPWADSYAGSPTGDYWAHSCDGRQRDYFRALKLRVYQPVPSLVDHRAIKSTLGNPSGRLAKWFIGVNESWRTVDWSRGADDPQRG
ncbi:MAG: hypothetical protein M3Z05_21920 [Gemmatimonadota bacterium]|nr:hypothetical protein [Gemmatimonadota bacterium]